MYVWLSRMCLGLRIACCMLLIDKIFIYNLQYLRPQKEDAANLAG
jgi:hypothetical protein